MNDTDTTEPPNNDDDMPLPEFLRLVNAGSVRMGKAMGGCSFPVLIAACMTLIEHAVLTAARPEARIPILNNIRASVDAIEAKALAEERRQAQLAQAEGAERTPDTPLH